MPAIFNSNTTINATLFIKQHFLFVFILHTHNFSILFLTYVVRFFNAASNCFISLMASLPKSFIFNSCFSSTVSFLAVAKIIRNEEYFFLQDVQAYLILSCCNLQLPILHQMSFTFRFHFIFDSCKHIISNCKQNLPKNIKN